MSAWEFVVGIGCGVAVNEYCDVSPWVARKVVRWSAHLRYADATRAEARAEELAALIDDRPGNLLKLITAFCFFTVAVGGAGRRASMDIRLRVRKSRRRAALTRLQDLIFDPAVLVRDLDLARFTGRQGLINRIDKFIATQNQGFVVVQGEAGVGKSTLAGHLVETRPWQHHFTRLPGGRSPEAARKSLAAQLIVRWGLTDWAPNGVLPESAGDPDWFDRLLHAVAKRRNAKEPGTPIVLVIDGLDDAEAGNANDGRLPLGLPVSLPDKVFIVITSRLGMDQILGAVRGPTDWQQIEAVGASNLQDMQLFIRNITDPKTGDPRLVAVLNADGVDLEWFRQTLATNCAGMWIYLRYMLDEIREGWRSPHHVGQLPGDLAEYYAQQIEHWRGDPTDMASQVQWEQVRMPLLGALAAARAPLTTDELAHFARIPKESARSFIENAARAFLNRHDDHMGTVRYSLLHQCLRDMLTGALPDGRPDLTALAETFAGQVNIAHHRIAATLLPQGVVGARDWQDSGSYLKRHLAAHAAASGLLDDLMRDPGFLAISDPDAVLAERESLYTGQGRRALEAFKLSLKGWDSCTISGRIEHLAVNAAKTGAIALVIACAKFTKSEWPIRWAALSSQNQRKPFGSRGNWVGAVAIGRAGERDVIASGSSDRTVQVWNAVTGEPVGRPLVGHGNWVGAVAIGRVGTRDVIVSGSDDGTVRIWDAVTGELVGEPMVGHKGRVNSVVIGRAGTGDVIVSGSDDGTVRIWDAVTGELVGEPMVGHKGRVNSVVIGRAGTGDVIVSGSDDGTVRIWDAVTGELVGEPMVGHKGRVNSVVIGRAGTRDVIVSGSDDGTVRIWDAVTGTMIGQALEGHQGPVHSLAIGQAGDRDIIVSGSFDRTTRIWDALTGAPLGEPLAGHDDEVLCVALARSGKRTVIVSSSGDGSIFLREYCRGVSD